MLKIVQIVTININELASGKFAFHHCRPKKKRSNILGIAYYHRLEHSPAVWDHFTCNVKKKIWTDKLCIPAIFGIQI